MGIVQINEDNLNKIDITLYGDAVKISDTLSKARARIFYRGFNRNRTYISEDFASQLIDSLPYCPIKGIFNYTDVDFEDHGEENTDGRIYGIIPETVNFAWEKHLDEDGIEREYACADVILYTALYPEASLIPGKGQSMEIYRKTLEYEYKIAEDGLPYIYFIKGSLLGLQALGNDHEPCFEGAAFFELYKETKDLVNYIRNFSKKQEGTNMGITNKEIKDLMFTEFKLSDSQKSDLIFMAINPEYNEEGDWRIDFWIREVYDDYAIIEKRGSREYFRLPYTKNEDSVTIGEKVAVFIVYATETERKALEAMQTVGGTYEQAEVLFSKANADVATLTKEKEELLKSIEDYKISVQDFETEKATFSEKFEKQERQIGELTNEKTEMEKSKATIEKEFAELTEFKKTIDTEKKTAILTDLCETLPESVIEDFKSKMDTFTVEDFKKEVVSVAYDNDPAIFKKSESELIYKQGSDKNLDTGVISILNKYKGGNK